MPASTSTTGRVVAFSAPTVGALVVVALVLRVPTLGVQSFWLDEAYTARVVDGGIAHVWRTIQQTENTPPLYYLLAWTWTQIVGHGDVALRAFSALVGALAVVPAALLGRRLGGHARGAATGLLAGALVAVSPMAQWFSQEARTYALVLLVGGFAWLALLRALDDPGSARAWWWAVAGVATAWAHYFGLLLLAFGWLVVLSSAHRRGGFAAVRRLLGPIAASGLAVAGLVPIALNQHATGMYAGIASQGGLLTRTAALPKEIAVGYAAPAGYIVGALGVFVLALLVMVALRRGDGGRRAAVLLTVAAAIWVIVEVTAVAGFDVVIARNFLLLLPAILAIVALGAVVAGRGLRVALLALVVVQIAIPPIIDLTPRDQREDWKGALRAADGPRPELLIVQRAQDVSVTHYRPRARSRTIQDPLGVPVRSIATIERRANRDAVAPPPAPPPPAPAPGFVVVARSRTDQYRVVVWRAPRPTPVTRSQLGVLPSLSTSTVYLDPGPRG